MPTVTVVGRAYEDVPPDRVRLSVAVQAEATGGSEALAVVADRSAALDAALDAAGELVLLRRPAAVTVTDRWGQDGQVVGLIARRTTTVEAIAGGPLGELLAAVSAVPGATVEGTEWLVDRDNAVHARLRAAAVVDAAARAGDYAGAAGLRVGGPEAIVEPGARVPDRAVLEYAPLAALSAKRADTGGGPVLELRPEPVTVETTIEVRYALIR